MDRTSARLVKIKKEYDSKKCAAVEPEHQAELDIARARDCKCPQFQV
jgi:hypothetical protein